MTIFIDSREKSRAIQKIIATFDAAGVDHASTKLFVGDYQNLDNPRIIVDRKQNLLEICGNVCQQHKRFTEELSRAKQHGIKLVILCEHGSGIKALEDVIHWKNPRLRTSPLAVSGERLYKIMFAMQKKYDVEWKFCDKAHTGQRILEILSIKEGGVDG